MSFRQWITSSEHWVDEINAALNALDSLDIDEVTRKTIRRALRETLGNAEESVQHAYEHRNSGKKWTEAEITTLENAIAEIDPPTGYQQQWLIAEMLSMRLGRDQRTVVKKAIELGHGKKVSYFYTWREGEKIG